MKIISGGQTGADIGALFGAMIVGIPTGGTAPKGFRTENGSLDWLGKIGLVETSSEDYRDRTEANVRDSDGTVIIASNTTSPGTRLTIGYVCKLNKPFLLNPTPEELIDFSIGKNVLNFAGNRESVSPGIGLKTQQLVVSAFGPKR